MSLKSTRKPSIVDGVLIGALQGLAILPGVSRSGTTASVLLLRGFNGETSLRLSFLLSIPAALGGGLLGYLESGGYPGLEWSLQSSRLRLQLRSATLPLMHSCVSFNESTSGLSVLSSAVWRSSAASYSYEQFAEPCWNCFLTPAPVPQIRRH